MVYTYLGNKYIKLIEIGKKVDDQLFDYPQNSIINARLYCELLVKYIMRSEGIIADYASSQLDKINLLHSHGLIEEEEKTQLNFIRMIGNKAVHQGESEDLETAISVHKKLYELTKWFIETYGDDPTIAVPSYVSPKPRTSELNKEDIEKVIRTLLDKDKIGISNDEVSIVEKESNKSHLLEELLKLKESSAFAVENINGFSEYKKYMHIDRPIQQKLKAVLEEVKVQEGATLVLLCGSVGDGKSHLINYFKEHEKDLIDGFQIHNDATESFSPEKTSLETLREELSEFSDAKIKDSTSKMILAINIGVLHNFMESEMSNGFSLLKKYIDEIAIFKSNGLSESSTKLFKVINFTDYNLFTLKKDRLDSDYISKLLRKMTVEDESNPFYSAYKKDLAKGIQGIHIENYKLLKNLRVQNKILRVLSLAIFEEKEMISTRALFNFIFDLLVPILEDENEANDLDNPKCLEYLLPNNLFGSNNKSILLTKVKKFDPLKYRNEELDQALMDFHNTMYIDEVFDKYLTITSDYKWVNTLKVTKGVLSSENEQIILGTLFRAAYLIGKEDWYGEEEKAFDEYVKLMFGYHTKCYDSVEKLDAIFRKAFFKWNGSPQEPYIFSEVNGNHIKTAYEISKEFDEDQYHPRYEGEEFIENYKMSILLPYKSPISLSTNRIDIDLPLFKLLIQVAEGYIPNSKDRENALAMEEFVKESRNSLSDENKLLFEVNNSQKFLITTEKKINGTKYIFKRA